MTKTVVPSTRAQVITRRTYNRPLDEAGETFETWDQTVERVIAHQRWLWERQLGRALSDVETLELMELQALFQSRAVLPSGRTLWLGGTNVSKRREASQFNCSFLRVETIHDIVDGFWLLLQGCGVGFEPVTGTLSGFVKSEIDVDIIPSARTTKGGNPDNAATITVTNTEIEYRLTIGDSAEAWAKAPGKLLALKQPVDRIVLDFSEIRGPGIRLNGYGWISSGYEPLMKALVAVIEILKRRADQLLTRMDILDLMNWLGTTLSSRRSAEIALVPYDDPEAWEFASAKDQYWNGNPQRAQSNNSLVFYRKPNKGELVDLFELMIRTGGSEPGFINGEAALKRAPHFKGVNPCAEILLGNKSFCNLVEIDLTRFMGPDDLPALTKAAWLVARANYRQTCVNLDDGILQRTWHELNEHLRLCGVGLTGIVAYLETVPNAEHKLQTVNVTAKSAANSMSAELGTPRPKLITTVKPSGTLSKVMGRIDQEVPEGVHRPLGKFMFNNVNFSRHDPVVVMLREANYEVIDHPFDDTAVLVKFPVVYDNINFHNQDGKEVNLESAVAQLERYKMMMSIWADHNVSVTISYSPDEVLQIVRWLDENWDHYVGVSWMFRNDPTKTAADLGHPYLPQEVVDYWTWYEYASKLRGVDVSGATPMSDLESDCTSGGCPIR